MGERNDLTSRLMVFFVVGADEGLQTWLSDSILGGNRGPQGLLFMVGAMVFLVMGMVAVVAVGTYAGDHVFEDPAMEDPVVVVVLDEMPLFTAPA